MSDDIFDSPDIFKIHSDKILNDFCYNVLSRINILKRSIEKHKKSIEESQKEINQLYASFKALGIGHAEMEINLHKFFGDEKWLNTIAIFV